MKCTRLLGTALVASTVLMGAVQASAAITSEAANPAQTTTEVQANLQIPSGGGDNPEPPSPVDPNKPVDPNNPGNKPNNPNGPFGIAYQPNVFNFGTHELKESGEQLISAQMPTSGDQKFHVGVKDKTREQKGWTLRATLVGDITTQPGISIVTGNATGEVQENISGVLSSAPVGSVTGNQNVEIDEAGALIMTGNDSVTHNSVYDYDLGSVQLKIENAKLVSAKNYTGSVNWDLSVTP